MPLGDHLEELRKRLISIIGVVLITSAVIWFFVYDIHELLMAPYIRIVEKKFPEGLNLILRNVSGPLVVMIKLTVMLGFSLSLPVIISIAWGFIIPAVTRFTSIIGHIIVAASGILFWTGMFICWKFIFPAALKFMLIDMLPAFVNPQLSLEEYYGFLFMIHIASGLGFQLPLLLIILGALGILTIGWHKKNWKYIIVSIFIFGALVTPPDPITQLILALSLIVLYVISVSIVFFIEKSTGNRNY